MLLLFEIFELTISSSKVIVPPTTTLSSMCSHNQNYLSVTTYPYNHCDIDIIQEWVNGASCRNNIIQFVF